MGMKQEHGGEGSRIKLPGRRCLALLLALLLAAGLLPQAALQEVQAAKQPKISVDSKITAGKSGKVTVKNLAKGQKVTITVKKTKILQAAKQQVVAKKAGTQTVKLTGVKAGSTKVVVKVFSKAKAKGKWKQVAKASVSVKVVKKASSGSKPSSGENKDEGDGANTEAQDEDPIAQRAAVEKPWVDSSVGNAVAQGYMPELKDDFYTAVNQDRLKTMKLDPKHTSEGTVYQRMNDIRDQRAAILKDEKLTSHDAKLVKDFYALWLDWDSRNAKGLQEAKPHVEALEKVQNLEELSAYMASEEGILWGGNFAPLEVAPDLLDSSKYTVHIYSTSLSLGDSAEYKEPTAYGQAMAAATQELYTYMLQRFGYDEAQITKLLADSSAFEKEIAAAIPTSAEQMTAGPREMSNTKTKAELQAASPNYPLVRILDAMGYGESKQFNLLIPKALEKLNELYTQEHFEQLKAYLLVNEAVSFMELTDEEAFRKGQELTNQLGGTSASYQDEDYAVEYTRAMLSTSMAKLYVEKYVADGTKQDITDLCTKIKESYRKMLEQEDWMTEETKKKALEKLDAIRINAVYPDVWTDTSKLSFKSREEGGSYLDACVELTKYNFALSKSRINQSVDKRGWAYEAADEVNAAYNAQDNSITVFAGILDGGVYSVDMSEEEKLGRIGAIIGHEFSHAFDQSGSQFDKDGNIQNWWSEADAKAFAERSGKLVAYYNKMVMFDGSSCNGALVQGEAMADMAGMKSVLIYAQDKENAGGSFDYDRFFRAFADLWCCISTPEFEQYRIAADEHPLAYLRANVTLQQFEKFYETYGIKEGDGMYLAPEERVSVW